jgi:hypothetical protein
MQHGDTPYEHARMLSLDGGTKVSEDSTIALCIESDVRILEYQQKQFISCLDGFCT